MEPVLFCLLIATGLFAGCMSGLLGVGGGFIFAPVMYFVLKMSGVAPETAILVAFGTSLAVALPTVLTSALGHSRKGNVIWRDAAVIGIAGIITGYIGGTVATYLPVAVLTFLFGVMLVIGAVRMVTALPSGAAQSLPTPAGIGIGGMTGFFSGLLGVGGGTIVVPMLTIFGKYQMRYAVATSAAAIVFITLGGIVSYLTNGIAAGVNLSSYGFYLIGYVDLVEWTILAVTAVPTALIGVKYANRFPDKILRKLFVLLMIVIALDMLGIFSLIGKILGL
ncbi:sulfite exporter TauE/SafE family protein [Methanocorpusculum vombati]|uniref:Probable membrane transporter protein n=1 Tax=Methanocorpusculum vombati TaxID=3002864 RepID=A0ABT4INA0_9EURY|nr:sulfite exporter TauE/SafE family protein [Methanocorpusculum vombati]MCZ9320347.1 sulfite exporter TauE/SafE family protein [Methanocorpusculum sp.]MCZ0863226.1 sulfite exporter TauE/SafE family protein [Methanocorpusculum vombati]MDE2520329.1 sulfite exporter TauE/SafE family protein [Methanocorpusculum sp.]MDE2534334.1 sulfite exporter TauE/SafE family protein [Methanocorpusculum sp.]MDE2546210.1 sulfite exporter TauE/SafE family protein [Methanocorpusculum sp.]